MCSFSIVILLIDVQVRIIASLGQGFKIHGSTGAPLPEKNYGWQKK